MVEPNHRQTAERVGLLHRDVGVGGEDRQQIERRVFPPIDLAVVQRRDLGHRIREI